MTNIKKVIAIALALLMIFSSASVLASAWSATVDDGFALDIETKFFKQVDGSWVETEKVRPGDTVKARVWLGTDYYSNDSTLLFFYDKTFFTDSYAATDTLEMNTAAGSFAVTNGVTGQITTDNTAFENRMVSDGIVTSDFLAANSYLHATLEFANTPNAIYDNSDWLFEFTLTVAEGASGEATLFVEPSTIQSTTQPNGIVNVPKGESTGTSLNIWPMWLWDATPTLTAQAVTTDSSVTFNANGGAFDAASTETYVAQGAIDSAINADDIPAISREGYTFMGWIDAADTTPTLAEVIAAPTQIPENDLVLNAYWLDNVNITFNTAGGSEVASHLDVTPYTDFADVTAPVREGYTFMGWSTDGATVTGLPETYPDVDTEYIAVWALDVTVSFNTNGADEIPSVVGPAGTPFTTEIANPSKEGHYFVKWSPSLPTVFPEQSTTYNAIFEANTYTASYYVDGVYHTAIDYEYGATILTNIPTIDLATGWALSGWYTDAEMQTPLAAGAVMGAADINLYASTSLQSYNAYFMVDDEIYETDENVLFGGQITAPATDPTKVGYIFTGWSPAVGEMDTAADKYFTATWEQAIYTVSYYSDGVLYEVYNIANGDELDVPADPVKTGYDFLGWDDDEEATTPVTLPQYLTTDSAKYYAVYGMNQYNAVFNANDGAFSDMTTSRTVVTNFGEIPVAPEAPTRTGYTFAGWSPELAPMTADGAVYEATWTANDQIYYVDIYYAGTDGLYAAEASDTVEMHSVSDAVVSYTHPEVTGFTADVENSILTGTVHASGTALRLIARYTRNQYTLTVSDAVGTPSTSTVYYQADVAEPSEPVRPGYDFTGWVDGNGNPVSEFPVPMPAEEYSLTATWALATDTAYTVKTYTMSANGNYVLSSAVKHGTTGAAVDETPADIATGFSLNTEASTLTGTIAADGSLVLSVYIDRNTYAFTTNSDGTTSSTDYLYGAAITTPEEPTKEGYTFIGWTPEIPATMPAEDITVTAVFEANTYTITYLVNHCGETVTAGRIDVIYGDPVPTIVPTFTLESGYTLSGWYEESTYTTALADGATVTGNDTLYAYTTANNYAATFYVDDALYETTYADYLEPISAPANDPTKVGHTFTGWSPVVGIMDSEGKRFDAIFEVNDVTVTYIVGGETYEVFTVAYGDELDVPADPYKEGYTFVGWSDTEGGTTEVELPETMPADPLTYYAIFTVDSYDAVFSAADADTPYSETVSVNYGAAITAPATLPERAGYSLIGWADPSAPTVVLESLGNMTTAGASFVAVWSANSATITYMVDGVQYGEIETLNVGDAIVPREAPTKEGYIFSGWSEIPATMPVGGVVVTGTFTIGTFTVTFTDYVTSAHGPAVDPTRSTTPYATSTGAFGSDITFPEAPAIANYTFTGWNTEEDGTGEFVTEGTIPGQDTTLYSIYERIPVKLIPAAGKPTVINRDAAHPTNNTISGFVSARKISSETAFRAFLAVEGDGRIVVTKMPGGWGTGTKVEVYDNVTNELVETFYVVLYGDLNGDGNINGTDSAILEAEIGTPTWSKRGTARVYYMFEAANLDNNSSVNSTDTAIHSAVVGKTKILDQTTGLSA